MDDLFWSGVAEGIFGSGGDKVKDDANTLRSTATARFIDLLGAGRIKGLVNGANSILFDGVPLQNPDGSFNYKGVEWDWRAGEYDQSPFRMQPGVETEKGVGITVRKNVPIIQSLEDSGFTSARVTIRIPALFEQTDKGMKQTAVYFHIEVRHRGGNWVSPFGGLTIAGKNTSPYDKSYRFDLPMHPIQGQPSHPWEVRVTRLKDDAKDLKVQDEIQFLLLAGINENRFSYPDSAMVSHIIDAEQFGSSLPPRVYHVDGLYLQVPSNYDPVNRTYHGIWDGTFKEEYCDNPAWVYYYLLTNRTNGLGDYLDALYIDKWSLYEIAKYCDEPVKSGYKTLTGVDIYEPRCRLWTVIEKEYEAYELLQLIASAFRGMAFWASGAVTASQDRPKDPSLLVGPANVIDGEFTYSSSGMKARHTVAEVSWKDPEDYGRVAVEVVRDIAGIQRYGERIRTIDGFGCPSRGQAHRLGQWILRSELMETQMLSYSAGLDHAFLRPGDIINVMDPAISAVDYQGRLRRATTTELILDREIEIEAGKTYKVYVVLPSGVVAERAVDLTPRGKGEAIRFSNPLPAIPLANAIWQLAVSDVNPKPYQILSIRQSKPHIFEITALENDYTKYAAIDFDIHFDPKPTRREPEVKPPTDLTYVEYQYFDNGIPRAKLAFSWKMPIGVFATYFRVVVECPDRTLKFDKYNGLSLDVEVEVAGKHRITVQTLGLNNAMSDPVTLEVDAQGWNGADAPEVRNLMINRSKEYEFDTADVLLTWQNFLPGAPDANLLYSHNTIEVFAVREDETVLLRTERYRGNEFVYTIQMNMEDSAPHGFFASRRLRFRVTLHDTKNRSSIPVSVEGFNPPIPVPPVTVQAGAQMIFVAWHMSNLPDYQATKVWIEDNPDFNPYVTEAKYNAKGGAYNHPANQIKTYYVRVGSYDTFGDGDMLISTPFEVTPFASSVDIEPPKTPTGLKMESSLQADGTALVIATWDANDEEDMLNYYFMGSLDGGDYVSIPVGSNRYEFQVMPGTRILARLKAYDQMGNGSPPSDPPVEHIAAFDTVPPEIPTELKTRASFRSIWLEWKETEAKDFARYLVAVRDAEGTPDEDYTGWYVSGSNTFNISGLGTGQTLWFYVGTEDTSGNFSGWSEGVSATTVGLFEGETAIMAPVAVDRIPDPPYDEKSPLKIFDRQTMKFYTLHEGEYVEENDAKLLTGTVSGRLIEALSITRDQIANSAISSTKITPRAIRTPLLATKAIKTRTIATGSVVADKIQAGSIETFHITADAVVAEKIAANVISAIHLRAENLITLRAQIADAIIDDAHILELSAVKIKAGTALAGSITVSGKALSSVSADAEEGARDPAERVNKGVTQIDAGKISIQGPTSLSSIFMGGNSTLIDGGKIAARTIQTNTAVFGLQNLNIEGIEFEHNAPAINQVRWTSGSITFINAAGLAVKNEIPAGNATWTANTLYIYYNALQPNIIQSGMNLQAIMQDSNNAVLAAYKGNTDLVAMGRTIIDGGKIKTQTIQAAQIASVAIEARHLAAGLVSADHIQTNTIQARHINSFQITTDKLASRSITTDKIALGDITGNLLADRIISENKLVQGSVTGSILGSGAVTSDKITSAGLAGSIIQDRTLWADLKLAVNSISGTLIGNDAVSTRHISAGQIVGGHIVAGHVTSDKIAANAVTADKISADTIQARHIIASQITTDKINTGAVSGFVYGEGMYGNIPTAGGTVVVLYWMSATAANSSGPLALSPTIQIHLHDRYIVNSGHPWVLTNYTQNNNGDTYSYQCNGSGVGVYTGIPVGTVGITVQCSHGFARWLAINFKR